MSLLKSCKDCGYCKNGYCRETDPPTKILNENQAQNCLKYTTSTSVEVTE